jgi:hypothetical protein
MSDARREAEITTEIDRSVDRFAKAMMGAHDMLFGHNGAAIRIANERLAEIGLKIVDTRSDETISQGDLLAAAHVEISNLRERVATVPLQEKLCEEAEAVIKRAVDLPAQHMRPRCRLCDATGLEKPYHEPYCPLDGLELAVTKLRAALGRLLKAQGFRP